MAKKSSASSLPGKRIRVNAEAIWNKPLNRRQREVLDRIAAEQTAGKDSDIDYSELPALSVTELAQLWRPPKKLVAVRSDADVFRWLQKFGPGYSTPIKLTICFES